MSRSNACSSYDGVLVSLVLIAAFLCGGAGVLTPYRAWAARKAAIVVDANTGKTLYARSADNRRYPASLTKMMTLYMVFNALERGRATLTTPITISKNAARQPSVAMGLPAGSSLPLGIAIQLLIVMSYNDIATAIAEHFGRSEQQFAKLMTRKAHALGMKHSSFRNASGLPNPQQTTTARDIATISLALRRDFPQYYGYFRLKSVRYKGKRYTTHNRVLTQYKGADGLKTGYTHASGFNLATSAVRSSKSLVGVVLGGSSAAKRDAAMVHLLDQAFPKASSRQTLYAQTATIPKPLPKPQQKRALAVLPKAKPHFAATTSADSPEGKPPRISPMPKPWPTLPTADGWAVQIGAFSSSSMAHDFSRKILPLVAVARGRHAQPVVSAISSRGRVLYRARLTGLPSYEAARSACDVLRGQNIDCVVAGSSSRAGELRSLGTTSADSS